jgi:hypothetical protein
VELLELPLEAIHCAPFVGVPCQMRLNHTLPLSC